METATTPKKRYWCVYYLTSPYYGTKGVTSVNKAALLPRYRVKRDEKTGAVTKSYVGRKATPAEMRIVGRTKAEKHYLEVQAYSKVEAIKLIKQAILPGDKRPIMGESHVFLWESDEWRGGYDGGLK